MLYNLRERYARYSCTTQESAETSRYCNTQELRRDSATRKSDRYNCTGKLRTAEAATPNRYL